MKNHYHKLVIICLMFFGYSVNAQSNLQQATFKDGNIALNKFLNKKFNEEAKKYSWPPCIISVVFAKFSIDSIGNVENLTFSKLQGPSQVFKTMLQSTILATNGLWVPCKIDGKRVESKPFILPLIYDIEAGCSIPGPDGKLVYNPTPDNTSTSLRYILKFEDNAGSNPIQIDCILLEPLRIFLII
jgi:hypothetical protein